MSIEEEQMRTWLFKLFVKKHELAPYEEPIKELLKICRNQQEFELIQHTLEKLVTVDAAYYQQVIIKFSKSFEKILGQLEGETALVAMAVDGQPDSSQRVAQEIKPHLDIKNSDIFNSTSQFVKKSNMKKYQNFILFDDFSGTGSTVLNRIKKINDRAKELNHEITGVVNLMFGMERAASALNESGIVSHFLATFEAGISSYFEGAELRRKIDAMLRLENELAPEYENNQLPSLGYGRAEALFFIAGQNAPNSNFPIFWWPIDVHGARRLTLMKRNLR
jgi:hypothetical protein